MDEGVLRVDANPLGFPIVLFRQLAVDEQGPLCRELDPTIAGLNARHQQIDDALGSVFE